MYTYIYTHIYVYISMAPQFKKASLHLSPKAREELVALVSPLALITFSLTSHQLQLVN